RGDERQWVESLQAGLGLALGPAKLDVATVTASLAFRLTYDHEIFWYDKSDVPTSRSTGYQTDLLICDEYSNKDWVPRVVIECKLGTVSTHDALTYSAKAATHKKVHPYLRYCILIGNWGQDPLPGRL